MQKAKVKSKKAYALNAFYLLINKVCRLLIGIGLDLCVNHKQLDAGL